MPHSLENLYKANSSLLNRETAISFITTCVNTYAHLWRVSQNQYLDIRCENIKAALKENRIVVKVLQPALT